MPLTTVYQGEVQHLQILDEDGRLDEALAADTLTDAEVKYLYEQMVICRAFDENAFKLQRSGRMGTFPQNRGAEAAALGAARALRKGHDWLVPYYRDNAAQFLHGLPMHYVLLHWMGDERGNAIPPNVTLSPINVAIGTQTLHAVGHAWAFKLRRQDKVAMVFFGDGATSTGDFHEAMNFAAVMRVPLVFSCQNNGWAISIPCCNQSASQTFAQKALAYGMPTIRVDGNDLFAVYKAHRDAVERARRGEGPSFVEALTYRLADHTTADDARRYRDPAEYEAAANRDPLIRTRKYLESKGLWDDEQQANIERRAKVIVQEVTQVATTIEPPHVEDIFDHTFADMPAEVLRQKQTMRTDSIGQDPEQIGLKMEHQSIA